MISAAIPSSPRKDTGTHRFPGRLALLYALVFVSGALALIYEILWMRRFVTLFGASSPAVSAVLMGMFLGLGVGSWVWGARANTSCSPVRTFFGGPAPSAAK